MPVLAIQVAGYTISLVGILLLLFQGAITHLLGKVRGFGIKTSSSVGGWISGLIGLVILTIAGVFGLSFLSFIALASFALLTIVSILIALVAKSNPLRWYQSSFSFVFKYLPKLGVLIGIVFSILNMVLLA